MGNNGSNISLEPLSKRRAEMVGEMVLGLAEAKSTEAIVSGLMTISQRLAEQNQHLADISSAIGTLKRAIVEKSDALLATLATPVQIQAAATKKAMPRKAEIKKTRTVLSAKQSSEITSLYLDPSIPTREIAAAYGIGHLTVSKIARRHGNKAAVEAAVRLRREKAARASAETRRAKKS